jgi:hypothetical protein
MDSKHTTINTPKTNIFHGFVITSGCCCCDYRGLLPLLVAS